jgi:FtsP/CotA-like multicopper oxidase with cupredoxin domain
MKTGLTKTLLPLAALLLVLGPAAAPAAVKSQCPADRDGVDGDGDGNPNNDHVCLHLTAGDGFLMMPTGRSLYSFGFSDVTGVADRRVMMEGMLGAELPAPTITIREGQKVYLNLSNVGMMMRPDLFDPHSVHWHGFPQAAPIFDGVPDASVAINMGATLTYFYAARDPGTYLYHCHVEATEHMQMGMLGNLYVTPRQDQLFRSTGITFEGRTYRRFAYNDGDGSTGYDVAYPIQIHALDSRFHDASLTVQPLPFALMADDYPALNGRGYPDTVKASAPVLNENGRASQKVPALVTARQGQRILLRLSSLATTRHFTLFSPSLPMQVVGKDARILRGPSGESLYYRTHSVTLGGGESVDAIVDTLGVPAGTYFLYTSNLSHLANGDEERGGMMTEIVVTAN